MPLHVKAVGLPQLLRKLDAEHLTEPERRGIIQEAGRFGRSNLEPRIPRDSGASASTLYATYTDAGARVAVDAFPLKFLEFGTVHIRRRRFMALTISRIRKHMREQLIPKAVAGIERRWRA